MPHTPTILTRELKSFQSFKRAIRCVSAARGSQSRENAAPAIAERQPFRKDLMVWCLVWLGVRDDFRNWLVTAVEFGNAG